jgi:predicted nucleotidyltransferase
MTNPATENIDIAPADLALLRSLLQQYLPDTAVWAHGSRVTKQAQSCSDLDLVVFSGAEQRPQISLLKEAFEESNLPFRVDLLEWETLPDNFKERIKANTVSVCS